MSGASIGHGPNWHTWLTHFVVDGTFDSCHTHFNLTWLQCPHGAQDFNDASREYFEKIGDRFVSGKKDRPTTERWVNLGKPTGVS